MKYSFFGAHPNYIILFLFNFIIFSNIKILQEKEKHENLTSELRRFRRESMILKLELNTEFEQLRKTIYQLKKKNEEYMKHKGHFISNFTK